MVDLPNDNDSKDNSLDNNMSPQVPVGPEGIPNPERKVVQELDKTEVPITNPEIPKTPEAPSLNEQISTITPEKGEKITTLYEVVENTPQIVDKTDKPTEVHEVKKPGDKLTKEADEEEEHFIEEVEKHHGNL